MTPTRIEQSSESKGDSREIDLVVSPVVSSLPETINTDPATAELLGYWARMNDAGRSDLLAVARGIAAGISRSVS